MAAVVQKSSLPSDGVRLQQAKIHSFIDSRDLGIGTLFITESHVAWVSETGTGITLDYPSITLHAISRDTASFPHPCIYLMVQDSKTNSASESEKVIGNKVARQLADGCNIASVQPITIGFSDDIANEEEKDNDDSETMDEKITEIRFVPEDPVALDVIFQALADCQALHPDQEDEDEWDDDDEEEEEEFEREGMEGCFVEQPQEMEFFDAQGQATLQRLNQMLAGQETAGGQIAEGGNRHICGREEFEDAPEDMS